MSLTAHVYQIYFAASPDLHQSPQTWATVGDGRVWVLDSAVEVVGPEDREIVEADFADAPV